MNYLSEMLKLPVLDVNGNKLGVVNDLGIATGEVFPHVTSLAFQGPGKTPFMISWRKYVDHVDESGVHLKACDTDVRFSFLQPDELLLARDILNKQIVDTQGLKVVRVNDLKLSSSGENQLRLLGAEVGMRGLLRAVHPALEHVAARIARAVGKPLEEHIIAWSYMDLLERSTQTIKLSVSHKTLDELHPADIADIIEQLDPRLRGQVFAQPGGVDPLVLAERPAELFDRKTFLGAGQSGDHVPGKPLAFDRIHPVEACFRLRALLRRIFRLRPRTLQNKQVERHERRPFETKRFRAVRQRIGQVGARPVQHRHKIIGNGTNTAGGQVAQALLVIFDIPLKFPSAGFDPLMDRNALNDAPYQPGIGNRPLSFADLIDAPCLPVGNMMQRRYHVRSPGLPDIPKADRIVRPVPAPRLFTQIHILYPFYGFPIAKIRFPF